MDTASHDTTDPIIPDLTYRAVVAGASVVIYYTAQVPSYQPNLVWGCHVWRDELQATHDTRPTLGEV